jgi:hypothetical protein
MANWKCSKCGTFNQESLAICGICNTPRVRPPGFEALMCLNCGQEVPDQANHCANCGKPNRANRLADATEYPSVASPPSVLCFAVRVNHTLIFAEPDMKAERLYMVGVGDILPVAGDSNEYYLLDLPGDDKGYLVKSSGYLVNVGLGEVKESLGYVRNLNDRKPAQVISFQPDGTEQILYKLKTEDRLPIVGERPDYYEVQLESGFRGFIHKGSVFRTISPSSLPSEKTGGLAEFALGAAALIGLGVIGGLMGDPEENRIKRTVERAMRDRGI